MSFRFSKTVRFDAEFKRIAAEQIEMTIDALRNTSFDRCTAVHQVRRRCKKIRGLLRLVYPQKKHEYRLENQHFRDIAASLSAVRDVDAAIAAFDKLRKYVDDRVSPEAIILIRDMLQEDRSLLCAEQREQDVQLDEVETKMTGVLRRLPAWSTQDVGQKAIRKNYIDAYRRVKETMRKARKSGTNEAFHEWRKAVKYHALHVALLKKWLPRSVTRNKKTMYRLAEILGNDHDLTVLQCALSKFGKSDCDAMSFRQVASALTRRRWKLRAKAEKIGRRMFAAKPKVVKRVLRKSWGH